MSFLAKAKQRAEQRTTTLKDQLSKTSRSLTKASNLSKVNNKNSKQKAPFSSTLQKKKDLSKSSSLSQYPDD